MKKAPGDDPEALWMGWWKSCSEQEGKQGQRPEEEEQDHEPDRAHDQACHGSADKPLRLRAEHCGRVYGIIHLQTFLCRRSRRSGDKPTGDRTAPTQPAA